MIDLSSDEFLKDWTNRPSKRAENRRTALAITGSPHMIGRYATKTFFPPPSVG